MSVVKKILVMTAMLFGLVTMINYVNFLFGNNYLFIFVKNVQMPYIVYFIISFIFLQIQITSVFCASLEVYSKKAILYLFPCYILCFFLGQINPNAPTIIHVIYILVASIIMKRFGLTLKRFSIISIIIILYQFLTLQIKTGVISLTYYEAITIYQQIVLAIDSTIMSLLILLVGGYAYYDELVKKNVRHGKFRGATILCLDFPTEEQNTANNRADSDALNSINKLRGFQRFKAMTLLLVFNCFQSGLILLACKYGNLLIEFLSLFVPYSLYGFFVIKKRWHSHSILACTGLGILSFYILSQFISPTVGYSQFYPVIVSLIFVLCLYKIAIYTDEYEMMKEKQNIESTIDSLAESIAELSK